MANHEKVDCCFAVISAFLGERRSGREKERERERLIGRASIKQHGNEMFSLRSLRFTIWTARNNKAQKTC